MKKNQKKRQRKIRKGLYTPKATQADIVALSLTGSKKAAIARKLGLNPGTITRVLSQQETQNLIQSYRSVVLSIVPDALIGLSHLVNATDRQAIIETLYGGKILINRQEVEAIEEPKRTYASSTLDFYYKHHRWPTLEEAMKHDKTMVRKPAVKGELVE